MTGQQLKNSILQMAVQGKLVPQDPNDEPASVLVERIREEKDRLIKEGKIKKEKNPSRIFRGADNLPYEQIGNSEPVCIADEVPFDIPDSWEWVRLKSIFNVVSARRVHQSDWKPKGVPFFRAREIGKLSDFGYVNNELYISEELYDAFSKSGVPKPGDIMVTAVGTLGKTYIVKDTDRFYYKDASVICFENIGSINPSYIQVVIQSPFFQEQIRGASSGTTVGTITIVNANEYILPIPPSEEQERIIAKLEEIEPHIVDYSNTYDSVENLNSDFPEQLKKSLLQWAVQGKLVPQDPNDEPASVLLERIQEEKARLIKEGKIRKDKNESIIYRRDNSHYEKLGNIENCIDDEIPFDIPESWAWSRLSNLVVKEIRRGKSPTYTEKSSILVFAQKCNTKAGHIDMSLAKYLDESVIAKYPQEEFMLNNDIVINSTGTGTMGRVSIFKESDNQRDLPIVPDSHVTIIRGNTEINSEFLELCLKYYQPYLEEHGEGSTNQKELKPHTIKNLLIPVPPIPEQCRITERHNRTTTAIDLI